MEQMNRRDFLKGTLATGAAAALAAGATSAVADEAADFVLDGDKAAAKWSFEIAPEPITDIAEEFEADLVVVGCGTAGLACANSAIEEGLSVIIVSASQKEVCRGGSNNAIYCKALERDGFERMPSWEIEREVYFASHKVDQKKWYKNYNNNETALNWAIDMMEEKGYEAIVEIGTPLDNPLFHQCSNAVGWGWGSNEPEEAIPTITGMMQPLFVRRMLQRFTEEYGGQVFFRHIGRQLVRGGVANGTSGRVEAVICEREDGSFAKFTGTKAVVLATGDFSANREMMKKYAPDWAYVISDDVYDGETDYDIPFVYGGLYKGEGHLMGLWCGAAWQRSYPNCCMVVARNSGPNYLYSTHTGLMVDRLGERFMNEYCMWPAATRTMQMLPGEQCFSIWDSKYAAYEMVSGNWTNDSIIDDPDERAAQAAADWDEKVASGQYVKGDTLEEVIEQLGLPLETTLETVARYNEYAHAGEDGEFHKNPEHLHPIEVGPFYGGFSNATYDFLTVCGGLRTNANMQVCDEADTPIEGLYNVGTMVGDVFSGLYTFQFEGANYGMCCITFGYLTGKYIAEHA